MGCEQRPQWLRVTATFCVSLVAIFVLGLCCHLVYKVHRSKSIPKLLRLHWVYILQSVSGFMTILTFLLWFWSPHRSGLSIAFAVGNMISAFFMGVFLFEMHIVSLNAFDGSMYAISAKLKQQYRVAVFILLFLYTVIWLVADTIASLVGSLFVSLLKLLLFILIGGLYVRIFRGFVTPLVSLIASMNVSRLGGVTRAASWRFQMTKLPMAVEMHSHAHATSSVPNSQLLTSTTPEAEAMDEEDFNELQEPSFIEDKSATAAGSSKIEKMKDEKKVPTVDTSLPSSKPSLGKRLSNNIVRLRKQTLSDFEESDHDFIHTAAKHSTLFMWVGIGGILWLASLKLNHCGSLQFLIALLFTLTMEVCCAFTSYLIFSNTGNEKVYALFCSTSHRCCVKLTACFVETEEEAVVTRKSQEKL